MILMQFVAEGGEKVKVESLDGKERGQVRVFVDHGLGGVSSFIVPAGVVMGLATALVTQEAVHLRAENAALKVQVTGHAERIAAQSELLSRRAQPPDRATTDPAAVSRGEVPNGVLPGLQL